MERVSTIRLQQDELGVCFPLTPGNYILFVDSSAVDVRELRGVPAPESVSMEIIPLQLNDGQSIEDAVALYRKESQ
jgi:hypothetical protein